MQYTKPSKAEYTIINKGNNFSELLFQGMGKFIQPMARLLIWIAGCCLSMIFLNVLTNDPKYIIALTYIGTCLLFVMIPLLIVCFSIIMFGSYLMRALIKTSRIFENSKKIIEPIEMILKRTQYIHSLILIIHRMNKFISLFLETKAINKINIYLQKYIDDLISFLLNLRSDLATRLTEQQKLLEGAKSEVEKNIVGTTELESVSELQKSRLDRQIEQFEELQRVLMKV